MPLFNPTVLVTGGAGYIGSHTVLALKQKGYNIVVLDNLVYGHRDLVESVLGVELVVGDINDYPLLVKLFRKYPISAVIHFAAYAYVGESVVNPQRYYRNNVVGTLTLLEAMVACRVNKIVFSSTCATYGIPDSNPISEDQLQRPINPYGASKLAVERILQDFYTAYQFQSVTFRYFNAAGADPEGRIGEDHTPEPHLIPLIFYTALGKRDYINILGTDYPTPDGTCIRDYIHVSDLAEAHILGLEHLLSGGETNLFNLGNGSGFSVREVIDTACSVTGKDMAVIESGRRLGDPPILVGGSEKARRVLGWQPQYSDLHKILSDAWQWHQKRHGTDGVLRDSALKDGFSKMTMLAADCGIEVHV
ncbi:UDP-glucose 4-epimerase GalE [Leptolyngbya sp. BC1307]|uniref:UDP-glucose 4-epimerase GalE n=1 Tax=Leptolyngbya sp. BC1307 TaxID=2029589 RepID=UPI000EFB5473|nr:UDP-glucose 4-epimerase GalE [Leptolyngbya sp. BC1307]